MTVEGNDNLQYEPTTQIHASDLLRAISEAGGDCGYRRYESNSEHDERTAEQHSVSQAGEDRGGGKAMQGRRKEELENRTLQAFYGPRGFQVRYKTSFHSNSSAVLATLLTSSPNIREKCSGP